MKPLRSLFIAAGLALACALAPFAPVPSVEAATPNVAVGGAQVAVIPLHVTGAVSATTAAVSRFHMPFACDVLGVGTAPRAMTGTGNTIDVKLGGVSILSAAITQTAATYTEGTITTSAIPDEGVITIDFTVPAGSLTDSTILLTCARK